MQLLKAVKHKAFWIMAQAAGPPFKHERPLLLLSHSTMAAAAEEKEP